MTAIKITIDPPRHLHEAAMLDIESMSLHPGAALMLSLGVVPFTLRNDAPLIGDDRLLMVFELADQLVAGRRVDGGTQAFWGRQPREAAAHFVDPLHLPGVGVRVVRCTVAEMARHLKAFLDEVCIPGREVYSQGIAFDISNLVAAMMDAGDEAPWFYNNVVDARSLRRKLPKRRTARPEIPGKAHDPVYDGLKQIWGLWEVASDEMLGVEPARPNPSARAGFESWFGERLAPSDLGEPLVRLHGDYSAWCEGTGVETQATLRTFAEYLRERGVVIRKKAGGHGRVVVVDGFGLMRAPDYAAPDLGDILPEPGSEAAA